MVMGGSRSTALVTASPSVANTASGCGATGTVLAHGVSQGTVKLRAAGRTDVIMRTITIAPGGSTGWHYHHGQLLTVVTSGTLTRTLQDRSVEVTPAGSVFIEPSGPEHRHIGRNTGSVPVVLYVTYLLPHGSPLAVNTAAPNWFNE
ncbi:cupin domain-containing protein [Streptomyces sp. NPDC005963]|uniref:cupin domain-containing protein n=1 Tax=Streptomyces sp. NPDC005963 TaxID=3156721 RepID=UPI0033D7EA72